MESRKLTVTEIIRIAQDKYEEAELEVVPGHLEKWATLVYGLPEGVIRDELDRYIEHDDVPGPSGFTECMIWDILDDEYRAAGLDYSPEIDTPMYISREEGRTEEDIREELRGYIAEELENRDEEEE